MIVSGGSNVIERGGAVTESTFKIKAAGKAFKILSDGLYSDKPMAIVRELCCNAYDAHVAAGNAHEPFEVHLPTHLEPWLTISDFGTGLSDFQIRGGYINHATGETMSHEDGDALIVEYNLVGNTLEAHPLAGFEKVGGIFTTYFESTKTDSNDYIGALGLGSKSPFSYVDSYTIISRHGGKKLSYTAFIAEDDCPAIALLGQEEYDGPNGLEISMPVRSHDFSTFASKAKTVLTWFDPKPKVTGVPHFETLPLVKKTSGNGWFMVENNPYGYYNAVAIQGKIAYPIDLNAIGYNHLSNDQRSVLSGPFIMEFNIGDLEVAASRETLSYKPQTIKNIIAAADRVIKEFPEKFKHYLDDCKTLWEARTKLLQLVSNNRILFSIMDSQGVKLEWQGQQLSHNDRHFKVETKDYPSVSLVWWSRSKAYGFKDETFYLSPDNDIEIFIDDVKRGGTTRVQTYHREERGSYKQTYLFKGDEAELDKLLDELGNPPVRKSSELPKAIRNKVVKSSVRELTTNNYGSFQWVDADVDEFDIEEGGLYMPMLRDKPVGKDDKMVPEFNDMIKLAKEMKLLNNDEVIYGATRSVIKQFKDNDDWKNAMEVIAERFKQYLVDNKLEETLALKQSYANWNSHHYYEQQLFYHATAMAERMGEDHDFVQFAKNLNRARVADTHRAQTMATRLGVELTQTSTKAYDFDVKWNELASKYPMLRIVRCHGSAELKTISTYMQLVDKTAEVKDTAE